MGSRLIDKLLAAFGALPLIGSVAYTALRWKELPAELPTHFDAAGHIDSYGGKSSVITLLVLSVAMYVLLTVLGLFLPALNRGGGGAFRVLGLRSFRIGPFSGAQTNSPAEVRVARTLLHAIGLMISLLFSYIVLRTVQCEDLGVWFMPVTIAVPLIGTLIGTFAAARAQGRI